MYCNRCGKEIKPEWKHCRYCGAEISASSKRHLGVKKNREKPESKAPKKRLWVISTVCVLLLVITASVVLKLHYNQSEVDAGEGQTTVSTDSTAEIDLPRLNAKTYFEERSEVVRVIDVSESEAIPTEKQAAELLISRGFADYPIMTDYAINGSFSPDSPTSSDSSKKHPVYTTYYVSDNEEYWTIYLINGTVIAYPISYNLQSSRSTKLVISETETVISYDNRENKFYETIPQGSELIVKTIDRIDAESLAKLTSKAIDTM